MYPLKFNQENVIVVASLHVNVYLSLVPGVKITLINVFLIKKRGILSIMCVFFEV